MSDLFEEIRGDLYRAKYQQIWEKYGKYFLGGLAVAVILLTAFFVQQNYQLNQNKKNSAQLYGLAKALDADNYNQANNFLAILEDKAKGHHKTIALLKKADTELKNSNISNAYNIVEQLWSNQANYKPHRDLAELILNYIIFRYPDDQQDSEKIAVALNKTNIFYPNIIEIRAMALFNRAEYKAAQAELAKIINDPHLAADKKAFAEEINNLIETQNS